MMGLAERVFPFLARTPADRRPAAVEPRAAGDGCVDLEPVTPRADVAAERLAELAQRLGEIQEEVGRLGREQFRATTLLEGQAASVDELAETGRELLDRSNRNANDARRALESLEGHVRLGIVHELLPAADALAESVRSARQLVAALRAEPPPDQPVLLRWLGVRRTCPQDARQSEAAESWLEGVLLVEQRLLALLERQGVRPIPALGQSFDPHVHLAVEVERHGRAPDGMVVREELRGYLLGERVLRPAEVVVARRGGDG